MKRLVILLFLGIGIVGCKQSPEVGQLKQGKWKGIMRLSENQELPFDFEISKDSSGEYSITVLNADEKVLFDEVSLLKDSIKVKLSVFDGELLGTFTMDSIEGKFIEENRDRIVPFSGFFGDYPRFNVTKEPKADVSGIWEVEFDFDKPEASYPAKGIFTQTDSLVTGTFRTNTGDYRYLEGVVDGNQCMLSTFDGTHAFLFTAEATDSTLNGTFYSGTHSVERFKAIRNEAFELPDSNTLTFLKEGYERFDFSFPDNSGNLVSLSDTKFQDKVVLVQIMGSWCPNCLDETRFYVDYLKNYPNENLEFIALAFEYAKTEEKAWVRLERLVEKEKIPYDVLLAQFGGANKTLANEKLPMLNHVLSYPTTIYVDKQGEVKKIHTGFNGPATGKKYDEFTQEFSKTLKALLSE